MNAARACYGLDCLWIVMLDPGVRLVSAYTSTVRAAGRVDNLGAEAVSLTFLQSILKGLRRNPRIETDRKAMEFGSILSARDVSCLVIPDGCLGLPTRAALEQGIPVIAVRDGGSLMNNDLSALPWAPGQFMVAGNYLEAAGLLGALRAGLAPDSLRRPMGGVPVTAISPRGRRPARTRANGHAGQAAVV